jgi:hypothetical protein
VSSQVQPLDIERLRDSNAVSAMGAASHSSNITTSSQELFYGDSSAVSFQHQVRETLRRSTGEADFNRPQRLVDKVRKKNLVMDHMSETRLSALTLPPRALADQLMDLYWTRVHCLYPVVHKPSFMRSYEEIWLSPNALKDDDSHQLQAVGLGGSSCGSSPFQCALIGMFALGCQFTDMTSEEREALTNSFFRRAKYFLHIDILDEGDLALIQALLLMGQYLQSTHYPDRCWNIVGLACRAAQGIGLHLDESNEGLPALEVEMRRRVWYGCVTLDL